MESIRADLAAPRARYELKYLVTRERAAQLKEALAPFCRPDRHTPPQGSVGYWITSLYLDDRTLLTYRAKRDRRLERFKLRVRTYGEAADGPVFLEVKRKFNDRVIKSRAPVARARWVGLLDGSLPAPDAGPALQTFLFTHGRLAARPAALVRYRREAFSGREEPYARVTLDHQLQVQLPMGYELRGAPRAWRSVDHPIATRRPRSLVVLELKFPNAAPRWMQALVRSFELDRVGFSKYCTGIEELYLDRTPGQERRRVPVLRSLVRLPQGG